MTTSGLCAAQHGPDLEYVRRINCPKALFDEHEGAFLVSLEIRTASYPAAPTDTTLHTWLAPAMCWTTRQAVRCQSWMSSTALRTNAG